MIRRISFAMALMAACGCGKPTLYPVTGEVKIAAKPAPHKPPPSRALNPNRKARRGFPPGRKMRCANHRKRGPNELAIFKRNP